MKIIALLTVICLFSFETPKVNGNLLTTYYYANVYYRTYIYRIATYRRYRYYSMNRLKQRARLYTFTSLGSAFYYQSMYSTAARIVGFRIVTTYDATRKCANFNTNPYGDFLGYFKCPLFFEPSNFTYCCGETDFNYCCSDHSKSNPYVPAVVTSPDTVGTIIGIAVGVSGGLFVIGVLITIICCCCCKTTRSRGTVRTVGRRGRVTTVHTDQTHQVVQPPAYPGAPPSYPAQTTIAVVAYSNRPVAQGGAYSNQPMAQGGAYSNQPMAQASGYPDQPPSYGSAANSYPPPNSVYPPVDAAYPPPDPAFQPMGPTFPTTKPPGDGGLPSVPPS